MHKKIFVTAVFMTAAVALGSLGAGAVGAQEAEERDAELDQDPAFAIVAELDFLAEEDLWPQFDPTEIPVAIYDGQRTLLFRHPSPPQGFEQVSGAMDVWEFDGRYPVVTANTSAQIGEITTATLMPDKRGYSILQRAGTLAHESFHVHQRNKHPTWSANEAELFLYPFDRADLLFLRRVETEALRRAVNSEDLDESACWAMAALQVRLDRFKELPPGSVGYERSSELNEGLATYVEFRAVPDQDRFSQLSAFPTEQVRQRTYQTGLALGRLLDRFSTDWREVLEDGDLRYLDELLQEALAEQEGLTCCELSEQELGQLRNTAVQEVEQLQVHRADQLQAFRQQSGWTLILNAQNAPLLMQRFDPLNVSLLSQDKVLHRRFLKLANDLGSLELLDRVALTEAAGNHPLFDGVCSLILSGLTEEPVVTEVEGRVSIAIEGFQADFRDVLVRRSDQTVTLELGAVD